MRHAELFHCSHVSCPVSPSPSQETQRYAELKSYSLADRRRLSDTCGTRSQLWVPEETTHLHLQGRGLIRPKHLTTVRTGAEVCVGGWGGGGGGQPCCNHAVETAPLLHAHGQTALSPLALRFTVFSGAPGVAAKAQAYALVERPSRGVRRQ